MRKIRLDQAITERGLVESRSLAQRLVMAGQVIVNGENAQKSSQMIDPDSIIQVIQKPRYVSRGGEKLEAALIAFNLQDLSGRVCVDVGSSTGGFTDCLLQHKAERVYAVDVGYGLLHWKLRNNPRIILMERTNARFIDSFPENVHLVTIDASFISLRIILDVVPGWFGGMKGDVVALIKPQFEAGRNEAAKYEGVIRDKNIHRSVLHDVLSSAVDYRLGVTGLIQSPLIGPKGNVEFMAHLVKSTNSLDIDELVEKVLDGREYPSY